MMRWLAALLCLALPAGAEEAALRCPAPLLLVIYGFAFVNQNWNLWRERQMHLAKSPPAH